jgi:hypothetical protein
MKNTLIVGIVMVCLLAMLSAGASAWWNNDWANEKCFQYQYGSRVNEPIRVNLSSVCQAGVDCLANYDDIRVIQANTSLTYQLVDMYYNTSTPYYWLYFIAPNTDEDVCLYWNNPNATSLNNASLFYFIDEMDGFTNFGYNPNPAYTQNWGGSLTMNQSVSYFTPPSPQTNWGRVFTPDETQPHCRDDVMTNEYFSAPVYIAFETMVVGHDGVGCPHYKQGDCGHNFIDLGVNVEHIYPDCYTAKNGMWWSYNSGGNIIVLYGNSTSATLVSGGTFEVPMLWVGKLYLSNTTIGWVWNTSGDLMGTATISDGIDPTSRQIQMGTWTNQEQFDLNYLYVSPINISTYDNQNTLVCNPLWSCSGYGNCLPDNTSLCNQVVDLNDCGVAYTGNYSEFEPDTCSYPPYCYQFAPNVSTECGGLGNGTYTCYGNYFPLMPCQQAFDNNRNTFGRASNDDEVATGWYSYFQKPQNSFGATYVIEGGGVLGGGICHNISIPSTSNYDVPQSCWDANATGLTIWVDSWHSQYLTLNCWNGTGYQQFYSEGQGQCWFPESIGETGVNWKLCSPEWECSDYGECQPDDNQYCFAVNETTQCGFAYTGNYSEFQPLSCDFCIPSWNCSDYSTECVGGHYLCNETTDLNQCGEAYTGDYSEFQDETCGEQQITGYLAQFGIGDIPKISVDLVGKTAVSFIGLAGLLGIILAVIILKKVLGRK